MIVATVSAEGLLVVWQALRDPSATIAAARIRKALIRLYMAKNIWFFFTNPAEV